MLVPYLGNLTSLEEDIMSTVTESEDQKLKEFESVRMQSLDAFYRSIGRSEPSIVLDDFLFLGSIQHATNQKLLERLQIKHILNVCDIDTEQTIQDNFNVIEIPMSDDSGTNIKQHFDRTNELLRGFYEKNERCLVHCAAGVSRSATIVLAYLMKYHHNTLKEAYLYLAEKRPQICPNEGFLIQLIRYEDELIQSREIKPNDENSSVTNEENPIETLNEFETKHETDNQ